MASGIKIADECKELFQNICITSVKTQKKDWMIMKFSCDNKKIEVEKSGTAQECSYDKLVENLPPKDVRYAVYDFVYINKDNCKKSDIILISWHPDGCPVKNKMMCASSFSALKAALGLSRNVLEGDCAAEVDSKAALEKVGGKAVPTCL